MTTTTYAPLRQRTSDVSFAAVSGGNLSSGSGYFWVSARNRAGFNQLSNGASSPGTAGINISWSANQQVRITINSGAVSAAEVYGLKEFVVSFNTTDDQTTARRVASIRYRDAVTVSSVSYPGEGAARSLPLTINLSRDEHLVFGSSQIVANQAALPSGVNAIHGMVRYSTADTAYYRLDTEAVSGVVAASSGYWVAHTEGFTQYVADTTQDVVAGTQPGGCDRAIQNLNADYIINPPPYTPDGSEQLYAPYFAVNNGLTADSGSNVVKGSRIAVRISQSGVDRSELFSSSAIGTLLGECTRSTGALNTSVTGSGSDIVLGDDELSSGLTGLVVPQDLIRGNCLIYQVKLQVDASKFGGRIKDNDQLQVLLFNEGRLGYPTRATVGRGNLISKTPDGRCRIVPGATTGAKRLSGAGQTVDDTVGIAYVFPPTGEANITGLTTDTADQIIALSGKLAGDVFARASAGAVLSFEKIRAKVSTAPGTYTASDSTGAIAISGSGQSLSIVVGYPCDADGVGTIRSNYPDIIAGNATGDFTPPELKVYVNKDSGGWQELSNTITITPNTTQTILITDISGASSVSLPDSSGTPSFGLWDYSSISGSAVTNSSSLASGSYQVRVAYHWPTSNGELTSITHSADDGVQITEETVTYAELVAANGNSGFTTTTANFTQPAIGSTVDISVESADWVSNGQTLFVQGGGYYTATRLSSQSLRLTNLGLTANASPSATINGSAKVSPAGEKGSDGTNGVDGADGAAATISEGTTTTLDAGQSATAANSGSSSAAVFDFGIPKGADGTPYGLKFTFSAGTASPAASGEIRFNNAAADSTTSIYVHETDRNSLNIGAILAQIPDGSQIAVQSESTITAVAYFTLDSQTDNGSDRTLSVTHLAGTPSLSSNVTLLFSPKGATGAQGATGPQGATGSVSSTSSVTVTTTSSAPSTGSGEIDVWARTSDNTLNHRDPSDGTNYTVADVNRVNTFTGKQTSDAWAIAEGSAPTTGANEFALWNSSGEASIRAESDGNSRAIAYQDLLINDQTGTTYTLALADRGKLVELNNASAITLTVPPNSSVAFPVGTQIMLRQKGAGQVTVVGGSGVSIQSSGAKAKSGAQHGPMALVKVASDVWWLFGELTA
ncbi:MAG: hypothetical protein AAGA75_15655 [Cyanobacteria bacterium P01_E01_bin.6]